MRVVHVSHAFVRVRVRVSVTRGDHLMSSGRLRMAEGAGFSGRYANKPLPDVSGVRFGLKLLLVSARIIVVGESLPAARHPAMPPRLDAEKRFRLLFTNFLRRRTHYRGIRPEINSTGRKTIGTRFRKLRGYSPIFLASPSEHRV